MCVHYVPVPVIENRSSSVSSHWRSVWAHHDYNFGFSLVLHWAALCQRLGGKVTFQMLLWAHANLKMWYVILNMVGTCPAGLQQQQKSISLRFIMHFWSLLDCKLRHRCEHSSCFCLKKRKWKTYKSLYGAKESTKFMSLMGTANCPSDLLLLISLNKTLSWRR